MTTKPKTRKTPANRAAKEMNQHQHGITETGWPIENRYDRNFSSNDIPKLIARSSRPIETITPPLPSTRNSQGLPGGGTRRSNAKSYKS
jgi:hypothetical protein